MSVYWHNAMKMPSEGRVLDGCIAYWDFDQERFAGDGDEDDFNTAPILYCAHHTQGSKAGTYMISCTDTHVQWRAALIAALGVKVLQNLPKDRSWWEDFAKLLQLGDDEDLSDNAALAYALEIMKWPLHEALVRYKTALTVLPETASSPRAAREYAAIKYLNEAKKTLDDFGCENLDAFFDEHLDPSHVIYRFAGEYAVIIHENDE